MLYCRNRTYSGVSYLFTRRFDVRCSGIPLEGST